MSKSTPVDHVSDTAFWIAHYRAVESARPQPLFQDPLAGVLAGSRGEDIARAMGTVPQIAWSVAIRTFLIDRFLLKAIEQGADTVLNLGAGLDTRPYRLALPASLKWIEADFDSILDFKEKKLESEKPRCNLERVKLDLGNRDQRKALLERVNGQSQNGVVLTEGVVPYLTPEHVAQLAQDLFSQEHFQYWIMDTYSAYFMNMYQKGKLRKQLLKNAPFQFFPDDWNAFFARQGWSIAQQDYYLEQSHLLGRKSPPGPFLLRLLLPFIPASKMKELIQMMGIGVFRRSSH